MSIMVRCPKGHVLKVKDSFAGKSGLCPICKARIDVPDPHADALSEDDIADLLGVPTQSHYAGGSASGIALHMPEAAHQTATELAPGKKECIKCHQEIPSGTHICPFCKTYIANMHDF